MQPDTSLRLCISGLEAPLVATLNACAKDIVMQRASHLRAYALNKPAVRPVTVSMHTWCDAVAIARNTDVHSAFQGDTQQAAVPCLSNMGPSVPRSPRIPGSLPKTMVQTAGSATELQPGIPLMHRHNEHACSTDMQDHCVQ